MCCWTATKSSVLDHCAESCAVCNSLMYIAFSQSENLRAEVLYPTGWDTRSTLSATSRLIFHGAEPGWFPVRQRHSDCEHMQYFPLTRLGSNGSVRLKLLLCSQLVYEKGGTPCVLSLYAVRVRTGCWYLWARWTAGWRLGPAVCVWAVVLAATWCWTCRACRSATRTSSDAATG